MSLYNYITERYNFDDNDMATFAYKRYLNIEDYTMIEKPYGFIIYKFEGDACIINDIYTTKEYRKTGKAWDLFKEVLELAQSKDTCNVLIGFSEKQGQGLEHGQGAMLAAGFKPVQETEDRIIYIRGKQ